MNRQTGAEEEAALQALRDVPEAIRGKNVLCEGCVRWMRLTCREQELWNVLYCASFGHQAIVRGDFQHVACLLKEAGGIEAEKGRNKKETKKDFPRRESNPDRQGESLLS